MRFVIDTFPQYRKKIEILYKSSGNFKELCDHYEESDMVLRGEESYEKIEREDDVNQMVLLMWTSYRYRKEHLNERPWSTEDSDEKNQA